MSDRICASSDVLKYGLPLAGATARALIGALTILVALGFGVKAAGEPPSPAEARRYADLEARPLYRFANVDLADYLRLRQADLDRRGALSAMPGEDVGHFGIKALGQPYIKFAFRFDLHGGDCVVFVERALALGLSEDWRSYRMLSDRLRHKDGIVDYRNRNFFTLGDWVPNNAWLLRDITGGLGPVDNRPAQTFTHTVRPKVFEDVVEEDGTTRPVFKGSDYKSSDVRVYTDLFIPRNRVPDVLPDLRTGDVVLVLRAAVGGHKGCDHLGLIVRQDDGLVLLAHSAPPLARQEPLLEFLKRFEFVDGFRFLRVRDDALQAVPAELERVADRIRVPEPIEEDQNNIRQRAKRQAQLARQAQQ